MASQTVGAQSSSPSTSTLQFPQFLNLTPLSQPFFPSSRPIQQPLSDIQTNNSSRGHRHSRANTPCRDICVARERHGVDRKTGDVPHLSVAGEGENAGGRRTLAPSEDVNLSIGKKSRSAGGVGVAGQEDREPLRPLNLSTGKTSGSAGSSEGSTGTIIHDRPGMLMHFIPTTPLISH